MATECEPTCPVEGGFYTPGTLNVGGNAVFLAVFALLAPAVVYLGVRFRTPLFSTILAVGLLLDVLGFVGRVLLKDSIDSQVFFLLSLLGTVIGPAFITGALISILPHVLSVYGEHLSPFLPLLGGIIPGSLQAVAVVVQVVGIVIMAFDLTSTGRMGGSRILTGGLVVQLLSLIGFAGTHLSFTLALRTRTVGLDPKHQSVYQSVRFKRFLIALWATTTLLVVHCVYRIVEIPTGLGGDLFQSEPAFFVVNGMLPFLAAGLLTFFHPGAAFGSAWNSTSPASLSQRRRHEPPAYLQPSNQQAQYHTQYRYEPELRKQISPGSQARHTRQGSVALPSPDSQGRHTRQGSLALPSPGSQGRHTRQDSLVDPPSGSPGLPSNPKAYAKGPSPQPSPTGTGINVGAGAPMAPDKTYSYRPEKRVGPSNKMVDSESLW